jgi:hypothetical protein
MTEIDQKIMKIKISTMGSLCEGLPGKNIIIIIR